MLESSLLVEEIHYCDGGGIGLGADFSLDSCTPLTDHDLLLQSSSLSPAVVKHCAGFAKDKTHLGNMFYIMSCGTYGLDPATGMSRSVQDREQNCLNKTSSIQ